MRSILSLDTSPFFSSSVTMSKKLCGEGDKEHVPALTPLILGV